MSSIPSLMPVPRIAEAIDAEGSARVPGLDASLARFLDEFTWYAQAMARARAEGLPR
jgi:hypothetical protein